MHLNILGAADRGRRDTTALKVARLAKLPLGFEAGRRGWVHRNLTLCVVELRRDRAEVAAVIKQRHYLRRWPVPLKTLLLSYQADLGGTGPAGAVVVVALLPTNLGALLQPLGLHQAEVLQLLRFWRNDDLTVETAPDFLPEVLRRIVKRWPAIGSSASAPTSLPGRG